MGLLDKFKIKSVGEKNVAKIEEDKRFFKDKEFYHLNDVLSRVDKLLKSELYEVDYRSGDKGLKLIFPIYNKTTNCMIRFLKCKNYMYKKVRMNIVDKSIEELREI